jgi:hypothetical protein
VGREILDANDEPLSHRSECRFKLLEFRSVRHLEKAIDLRQVPI